MKQFKVFLYISTLMLTMVVEANAATCGDNNYKNEQDATCIDNCIVDSSKSYCKDINDACAKLQDKNQTSLCINFCASAYVNTYCADFDAYCKSNDNQGDPIYSCTTAESATLCDDLYDLSGFTSPLDCSTGGGGGGVISSDPSDIDLSSSPLFLGTYGSPNVVIALDDSDKMMFEVLPTDSSYSLEATYVFPPENNVYGPGVTAEEDVVASFEVNNKESMKARSPEINALYYNPAVDYQPWVDKYGNRYQTSETGGTFNNGVSDVTYFDFTGDVYVDASNASATEIRAPFHVPFSGEDVATDGYLVVNQLNLTASAASTTWFDINGNDTIAATTRYYPAMYYRFNETLPSCSATSKVDSPNCYQQYVIAADQTAVDALKADADGISSSALVYSSDSQYAAGRTYAEEIQNFANWYTYYRSKVLLTRALLGAEMVDVPLDWRFGFVTTKYDNTSAPTAHDNLLATVNELTSNNVDIYNYLYGTASSATPSFFGGSALYNELLRAVGDFFDLDTWSINNPWRDDPVEALAVNETDDNGTAGHQVDEAKYCRRSFNLFIAGDESSSTIDVGALDDYFDVGLSGSSGLITNLGGTPSPAMSQIDADYDGLYDAYGDDPAVHSHLNNLIITLGPEITGTPVDLGDLISSISYGTTNTDKLYKLAVETAGRFYQPGSYDELQQAIASALDVVYSSSGYVNTELSGSSVALNSGSLFDGSYLYQALFKASYWSGRLVAYSIDSVTGSLTEVARSNVPAKDARNIASQKCDNSNCSGYDFNSTNAATIITFQDYIGGATLESYFKDPNNASSNASNTISWIKGDISLGASYKSRESLNDDWTSGQNLLGDIVNAAPIYVGEPNFNYYDAVKMPEAAYYAAFVEDNDNCPAIDANDSCRDEMVYVGSNDGMLHMFKADLDNDADTGNELKEIGAYLPRAVIREGNLAMLAEAGNDHNYFVDSTPTIGDAYYSGAWHTVLVGGLGAGGKGVYALDITNPTALASNNSASGLPSKVLWEYPSAGDDDDLGYTYSRPNIVRLPSGDWGAVFGNGYNSKNGDACIYVVKIEDGSAAINSNGSNFVYKECVGVTYADVPQYGGVDLANHKNGMSTVTPVDSDGDLNADFIYGGDLYGNIWRFELDIDNGGDLVIADKDKVFVAGVYDGSQNLIQIQPITTRINAAATPLAAQDGIMLYFGTGQYLEEDDTLASRVSEVQSYYGVWDAQEANPTVVYPHHLLQQEIIFEDFIGSGDNRYQYRVTSDYELNWLVDANGNASPSSNPECINTSNIDYPGANCSYWGWRMDLYPKNTYDDVNNALVSNTTKFGEIQVTDSIISNGRVIFTTTIPDRTVCGSAETGWLMELDAKDGSRLSFSPFNVDNDENNQFNQNDYMSYQIGQATIKVPVSGRKSKVGLLPTPGVLSDYSDPTAGKEFKYMSGSSGSIESITENAGGASSSPGRKNWMRLR